jgi:hypothetical protein
MANNIYHNSNYNFPQQPRQPGGMAAYLLGMGEMPPPCPQDIAVALFNRAIDNPGFDAAAGADDHDEDDEDENIDPQLMGLPHTQAAPGELPLCDRNSLFLTLSPAGRVIVRVPINDKVTRDIEFQHDIPCADFRDRIMAAMSLDPATAQLGWKTSDESKRAPAHQLSSDSDIDNAFKTVLGIQNNPRRKKEIIMEIIHLVNPSLLSPWLDLIICSEPRACCSCQEEE